MNRQIDEERLMELVATLPSSPRNSRINKLDIAQHVIYLLAAFCAWQLGRWWGLGLVAAFYVISVLHDLAYEEHRQELIEMNGKIIAAIAESSDILDERIPIKHE